MSIFFIIKKFYLGLRRFGRQGYQFQNFINLKQNYLNLYGQKVSKTIKRFKDSKIWSQLSFTHNSNKDNDRYSTLKKYGF